jgi:MFS family permease
MPEYLHQHLKVHHPHFTQINELYASISLYVFSFGLVGIFVPIYIYNLGFSIPRLAAYFVILELTRAILSPMAALLVKKFGPKHMLILSFILMFCYVLILYSLPQAEWLLYAASVVGGGALCVFWMARHIDLASVISSKQPTSQFTTLLIFSYVAQAMSPLIGGVIATNYGIGYGFLVAGFGLLLASYPLLASLEPHIPGKTDIRLFRTAPKKHLLASFAMNAQGSVGILIWPLFIFLAVETYQDVGIITSFSLLLTLVLLKFLGKAGDQGQNSIVLKIGSYLRSIVHTARFLAKSFLSAFGVNVLGDLTDSLASVPYAIRFYEGARKYGVTAYLTDMETIGNLGKALPWITILIVGAHFGLKNAIIVTFAIAAVLTPLMRLIEPVSSSANQTAASE